MKYKLKSGYLIGQISKQFMYTYHIIPYMGNIWQGKKLANHELFALPIFTDTLKMYLAYTLTVAYLPNFSYK